MIDPESDAFQLGLRDRRLNFYNPPETDTENYEAGFNGQFPPNTSPILQPIIFNKIVVDL